MKTLEDFIRPTQKKLFKLLCKKFKGKTTFSKDNFILVRGTAPVMLVAHLDTVHTEPVKQICASKDGNILMSPQGIGGDDRCGVSLSSKFTCPRSSSRGYSSLATRKLADWAHNNFASLIRNVACRTNLTP